MQRLKKFLIALPVMLIFMFLMTGMVNAEAVKTGTVKGETVNLRAKPDTSAKILIQIPDGTKVSILAEQGDWYKVNSNDTEGWIFSQFVVVKSTVLAAGTVKAENVNVRSKPDTSSEVLTKLDKGAKVSIYERTAQWYRIQIEEGRFGWVSRDFVTEKTETASRGAGDDVRPAVNPQKDTSASDDKDADVRKQIVEYAKKFLGVKYVYGGSSSKGFDCSGFVQYVFKKFDIDLVRTSDGQGANGTKIKRSELKAGDLVFFDTNGGLNHIEHVGIYIGGGNFIHASSSSEHHKVTISELNSGFYDESYMTARRYVKD